MRLLARLGMLFGLLMAYESFSQQSGKAEQTIDSINKLALSKSESDPLQALQITLTSITKARRLNYSVGLSKAYNTRGICYDVLGNADSALHYYKQALLYVKQGDPFKAGIYSNIGLVFWNQDLYPEALSYFNLAALVSEAGSNLLIRSNIQNNLGLIYHDVKDYRASNYHFQRAIDLLQKTGDTLKSIAASLNMAINYFETGQTKEAATLFGFCYRFYPQADDYLRSEILAGKATFEINTQPNDSTEILLQKVIALKEQIGHELGLVNAYLQQGELYHKERKYDASNRVIYKALSYKPALTALKKMESAYHLLFLNYLQLHQNDSVIKYSELYTQVIDSMFSDTKINAFARAQVAFKTHEKEKANWQLQMENERIRNTQKVWGIALSLLLGFVLLSWWLVSRNQRQKAERIQQKRLTQALFESEQAERERVARDLHDGVGQKLAAAKMYLSLNPVGIDNVRMTGLMDEAISEIRQAAHNLMPLALKRGLSAAVREMADEINWKGTSILMVVTSTAEVDTTRFPEHLEIIVYRIVQEAVSNTLKHAMASRIEVDMANQSGVLYLMISDNGVGFNEQLKMSDGLGLTGIRKRVTQLNGTLALKSIQGKGTSYKISIPVKL